MKTKAKWYVITAVILAISFVIFVQNTKEAKPEEAKNTIGTLTIHDENGEVLYQYMGDMEISGDEIAINLPSTHCSCFDKDGNFIKRERAVREWLQREY